MLLFGYSSPPLVWLSGSIAHENSAFLYVRASFYSTNKANSNSCLLTSFIIVFEYCKQTKSCHFTLKLIALKCRRLMHKHRYAFEMVGG